MVALTHCEWCLSFSGRYAKGNRCCQIRMLAGMPKEHRKREYARIEASEGRAALTELIELVKAEYLRGQSNAAARVKE